MSLGAMALWPPALAADQSAGPVVKHGQDRDGRTIHRHLAQRNTTIVLLVPVVRQEMALHYVPGAGRSLSQGADMPGFSNLSAFSAWFRRHHACPASR